MRVPAILAAGLVTAASLSTALFLRADWPTSAHAKSHSKSQVTSTASIRRVRLGIISYNLPLFERQTGIHPIDYRRHDDGLRRKVVDRILWRYARDI